MTSLNAIKDAGPWNVNVSNNTITIDVASPEEENPIINDAIYRAGGKLQSMTITTSSLEEAYLSLVRSS